MDLEGFRSTPERVQIRLEVISWVGWCFIAYKVGAVWRQIDDFRPKSKFNCLKYGLTNAKRSIIGNEIKTLRDHPALNFFFLGTKSGPIFFFFFLNYSSSSLAHSMHIFKTKLITFVLFTVDTYIFTWNACFCWVLDARIYILNHQGVFYSARKYT